MAVNLPDNIGYRGANPNFARDIVNTKSELLAENPANKFYPYGHIVFCKEDAVHYVFSYNHDNPPADDSGKSAETGWFLPLTTSQTGGGGGDVDLSDYYTKSEVNEIAENLNDRITELSPAPVYNANTGTLTL